MYTEGDLVFAKLKGYRYWPAKINKTTIKENNKTMSYNVTFFGEHTTSKINESNLLPYAENKHIHGIPQEDNYKNKHFNKALKEADAIFKTIKAPESETEQNCTPSEMLDNQCNYSTLACEPTLTTPATGIEDIKTKLQNSYDSQDLEASLTLAAEVGQALLFENMRLKQDLHNMSLTNGKLQKQVADTSMTDQDRIEELEYEKDLLLEKNNKLTETIDEIGKQLAKEKKTRNELLTMFEELDKEKEQIICNYETEIGKLRKLLQQFERESETKNKNNHLEQQSVATQTHNPDTNSQGQNDSSCALLKLAHLQIRQEQVEKEMGKMKTLLQRPWDQENKKITEQDPNENIVKPLTPKPSPQIKPGKKRDRKENIFSVSLQVAKSLAMTYGQAISNKSTKQTTHQTTEGHIEQTEGACQTPPQKTVP